MDAMNVKERREKLVLQFELIIQDEHNMDHLEQMFQSILGLNDTLLNEDQKNEVLRTRQQVISGEMKTNPWNQVKSKLDAKYGL